MWDEFAELYDIIVVKQHPTSPLYEEALRQWELAQGGDSLTIEDAAYYRQYAWGSIAFAYGLHAGFTLGHSLSGI